MFRFGIFFIVFCDRWENIFSVRRTIYFSSRGAIIYRRAHIIFSSRGAIIYCTPGARYILAPRLKNILCAQRTIYSRAAAQEYIVRRTHYVVSSRSSRIYCAPELRRENISCAGRRIYYPAGMRVTQLLGRQHFNNPSAQCFTNLRGL